MRHHKLHSFIYPKSVCIVGVSFEFDKVGNILARNLKLQGYQGSIYFVNPKGGELYGYKVYESISAIEKPVEVYIFATPAAVTLELIEQNSTYIKNVCVIAAGFKETHSEVAQANESRLKQLQDKHGFTLLGPNCAGYINTKIGLNGTFLPGPILPGNIACISQSGAVVSSLINDSFYDPIMKFSMMLSLGNKSGIDEVSALEFAALDPNTQVIALYLEDISAGERFKQVLHEATKHKPVVVLKSGLTLAGAAAASTHTGSLATDTAVLKSVVAMCGAIWAESYDHLLCILKLLATGACPANPNMSVVTNAGGFAVMTADAITKSKSLKLAKLKTKPIANDPHLLPNPLDVLGDASATKFATAIAEVQAESELGAIIVIVTPQSNTQFEDTSKVIVANYSKGKLPIYPVFLGGKSHSVVHDIFASNNIAVFTSVPMLVAALDAIVTAKLHRLAAVTHSTPHKKHNLHTSTLTLHKSMQVLENFGINFAPYHVITSQQDLHKLFDLHECPYVMKASSSASHKTEAHAVRTNVCTIAQASQILKEFMADLPGFECAILQRQIVGYELIVGSHIDTTFGPTLVLGMGGVLTELLKIAHSFPLPATPDYVKSQVGSSAVGRILSGYRGHKPVPEAEVSRVISAINSLYEKSSMISEVDINPLFVTPDGKLLAADARVVVRK